MMPWIHRPWRHRAGGDKARSGASRRASVRRGGGIVAAVLGAWLFTACQGGSVDRGGATIQVDLRPLVQQMGGAPGGSAPASATFAPAAQGGPTPESITGPVDSIATTAVQSLIVGAVAIGFQATPLGPNTAITDTLKTSIRNALLNSTKFITLVRLPSNQSFVEFNVPPPEAIHWQVVVVGTRDTLGSLPDMRDDSPIYYGFNTDANGTGVFLSAKTVGSTPIDIQMKRACVVTSPPNGCAQYKDRSTPVVTQGVEIIHVYGINPNGTVSSTELLAGGPLVVRSTGGATCNSSAGCTVAVAVAAMPNSAALAPYIGAVVQTNHQRSPAQTADCIGASTDTLADLAKLNTPSCSVETYTTMF